MRLTDEQATEYKRRVEVYVEAVGCKTEIDKHFARSYFHDAKDFILECAERLARENND